MEERKRSGYEAERDECEVSERDECEVGVRDECEVGVRDEYKKKSVAVRDWH